MRARRIVAYLTSFALHLAPVLVLLVLTRVVAGEHAPHVRVIAVATLPAADDPDAPPPPPRPEGPGVKGSPRLDVGGFTFDIDRIARRRRALFPFITGDLAFEYLSHSLSRSRGASLVNPLAPRRTDAAPPLTLRPGELQQIVDGTWSRRDRWASFADIRALLDRYDGNTGGVPLVLRSYLTQNILQPYWDARIPDPRVWVMLGLSSDHADFIDFITNYVHEHPASKATTELLFLLDKLVQGNRDTLLALLAITPDVEAGFTRSASPEAFDLLVGIQRDYRQTLAARGLITPVEIGRRYDAVRLMILRAIVERSPDGYLADDARFLAGGIDWQAGRADEALQWWRDMHPTPEDVYYESERRLQGVLVNGDYRAREVDGRLVNRVLQAEYGRWLMFSYDRLRQFGYRFETY